jgi:hypothetical protein
VVPTNSRAIALFWVEITKRWRRVLNQHGQRGNLTWARMMKLASDWLPQPHIRHPWPNQRFAVTHPKVGAACGTAACTVLGRSAMSVPTATVSPIDRNPIMTLSHALERRFKSAFTDPVFTPLQRELQAITDAVWGGGPDRLRWFWLMTVNGPTRAERAATWRKPGAISEELGRMKRVGKAGRGKFEVANK